MKQGWEIKKLREVCKVIAGQSPEGKFYNSQGNGMPFYQGKKEYGEKYIGEPTTWTTKITKEADAGDILISVRAPVGPVNFATQKICIGRGLAAIRAGKNIDKEFLFNYFIKHESEIEGNAGAVFNSINKTQIENLKIPLPPLSEQKRIVAILDEAFAAIAKAKANAEQNLKNAKELFESYLQGVFENPKENWEVCSLESNIKLIDYRGRTPVKTESGVRLITAKNVKLGFLQIEPQEFIAENNYESWMSRGIPNFGDVIFTTEAPLANVAQINTMEKLAFAQRIIVMQPKQTKLNQTFLKYMLLSNPIRNKILGKGTGATVLGIKSSLLKKIEIYFPKSIQEQQIIVQKLDALSAETKKLEAIYQQKVNDLEELKKSVLQKAFAGELKTEKELA
jgi:type I restriction enzyme S subunit